MQSSTVIFLFGLVATTFAAPALQWSDPTICAPGTGYYQSCSSGYKGCCPTDACAVGYCPTSGSAPTNSPYTGSDPSVCAPGTGYYQVCSNGFKGCSTKDECAAPKARRAVAWSDPTLCAPGTGFFQSCSNGFRGCCASDACSLGYCPPAAIPKRSECAPGTGYHQVCANGFQGCSTKDECSAPAHAPETHTSTGSPAGGDGICAPGTGFFQVCSNGFQGCCKSDACGLGYCPY